jgi:hypothetical protein
LKYSWKSLINIDKQIGGIEMYEIEKGSIQEMLFILQDIGLQLNEYEKNHTDISVKAYKELLEFSIVVARRTTDVSDTVDEIIDVIEKDL